MKQFEGLAEGTKIFNKTDGVMTIMYYDFYGDGKIVCLAGNKSIFPAWQFDPSMWEVIK